MIGLRLVARQVGPAMIAAFVLALGVVWIVDYPPDQHAASYLGQLLGAESVLLLSIGLVLISTLPLVESWFDGIDRAAIWHRRVSIAGVLLLIPHIMLAANRNGTLIGAPLGVLGLGGMAALATWSMLPRWRSVLPRMVRPLVEQLLSVPLVRRASALLGGYDRWRMLHRCTGLFVAAGFVHGLLDATMFGKGGLLRVSYVVIGGIGLGFYAYRELLARHLAPLHDYQVASIAVVGPGLVEVALRPLGRRFAFTPGQFAMVYLEARDGWHRHPFTIASAPSEPVLRFTIKALGDYTSKLGDLVSPGMPAVIGGPHGRFHHTKGTDRQVWIAGGVGVTPFLSWLRSLREHPARGPVDFFYTSAEADKPYAQEITAIAAASPDIRVHLVDTSSHGRLDGQRVLATVGGAPRGLSVFLCGPDAMVRALQTQLRAAGVSAANIHREYFDWR